MSARTFAVMLVAAGMCTGCFSKTRIYSRPAGASVLIDNKRSLGQTPVEIEEQVWVWTKHAITLQAQGYQPRTVQIRSTGVNWGYAVACACTLGILLPLGLLSSYPAQYVVDLVPLTPDEASPPLQESAAVTFR